MKLHIRAIDKNALAEIVSGSWRLPSYRTDQILDWVYRRKVMHWDGMSNLPKSLREKLAETFRFTNPVLARLTGSTDTTRKFLWKLEDDAYIESVLIPANPGLYGEPSDRNTLCVSTQVGCAYGCRFCASGLDGWKRNLEIHEIVGQVLNVEQHVGELERAQSVNAVDSDPKSKPSELGALAKSVVKDSRVIGNLVIMGMGEPLANFEALMASLSLINAEWGGGIGARKITISTSGLAPRIRDLAEHPSQYRLAISLHGATDVIREKIMPINRRYPIPVLADAIEYYQRKKGKMVTFEYILIQGVNDGLDQIAPLSKLAQRLNAKVNLIPYNSVDGLSWQRPTELVQERFLSALEKAGVPVTLRREKGHDIDAACGQLRLRTERGL